MSINEPSGRMPRWWLWAVIVICCILLAVVLIGRASGATVGQLATIEGVVLVLVLVTTLALGRRTRR